MKPNPERLQRELLVDAYLEALENDDFETEGRLWEMAASDPELIERFEQLHTDLLAEQAATEAATVTESLTHTVQQHLKAEIVTTPPAVTCVQAVAEELFRDPPERLSAASHALIERLRQDAAPLPEDLALSNLTAWLEARFGTAEASLWKAFRSAALKLEARRTSAVEYQMAARQAPKPESPP